MLKYSLFRHLHDRLVHGSWAHCSMEGMSAIYPLFWAWVHVWCLKITSFRERMEGAFVLVDILYETLFHCFIRTISKLLQSMQMMECLYKNTRYCDKLSGMLVCVYYLGTSAPSPVWTRLSIPWICAYWPDLCTLCTSVVQVQVTIRQCMLE